MPPNVNNIAGDTTKIICWTTWALTASVSIDLRGMKVKMTKRSSMMSMGWRKRIFPAATGLCVLLIAAVIHFYNPSIMERFGNQLFDQFQRWSPRAYEDVGVRVVDIDEESLRRVGQWPWPRTQIAEMTERMFNLAHPVEVDGETFLAPSVGAVSFDIVFSEPDRTSPENLKNTLEKGGASPEVISGLEEYVPHDQVFGNKLSGWTQNFRAVIMGYFFEKAQGADVQPKTRVGPVSAGEIPLLSLEWYASVTDSINVLNDNAFDAGFVSTPQDSDGITRKAAMLAYLDTGAELDDPFAIFGIYPSLSLATYRFFLEAMGEPASGYRIETTTRSGQMGARASEISGIRFGETFVPLTARGDLVVHYTEGLENRVVPAWKLLDPSIPDRELADLFAPKTGERAGQPALVFVGAGAQGLRDLRSTPVEARLPGVLIHAQALEQMLLGHFLGKPDWAPGVRLLVLILGGVALVLIVPTAGPLRSGILGILILGGLFYGSWYAYENKQMLFDPVYPAAALLIVYLVTSTVSFVVTEAEKSHINGAFSRYLSPDMVARIADNPDSLTLGGENRDMTLLFSDIRSFSKISEGMTPGELTSFINRYLTPMTEILMSNKATVDKYIGDAVMAFWNAPLDDPDHPKNAARAALAMMDRLAVMNANRNNPSAPEAEKLPVETSIGIGLYSGDCSVGNMGSDQRFDYSVLGDTVNTAARLEGMTKQYGVGILVGDQTAERLGGFAVVELDRAKAVGKENWLVIYALVGDEQVANDPAFADLLSLQERFLDAYRAQHFDDAQVLLETLSTKGEAFGLGKHYEIMKERIEAYQMNPPPQDWNGVYVLRQK